MEIELERLIVVCRWAVTQFAETLDEATADTLCRKTRSLCLCVTSAAAIYEGVLTAERSLAVKEVFEAALQAHEVFDKDVAPTISQAERERVAGYRRRLKERYESLKDILIHPEPTVRSA